MANNGFILVHRTLTENWIWQDAEKLKAWMDLLFLANYEDKKYPYKGEIIVCKRGDVNLSISELAKRWHWSRDKARRFLQLLEDDNMVVVNATTNRTTITLVNYEKMQKPHATNNTTNKATDKATSNTTSRQRVSQRADTTNKSKINTNKDKENIYASQTSDDDCYSDEEWEEMNKKWREEHGII